jgi:hypothetical protein
MATCVTHLPQGRTPRGGTAPICWNISGRFSSSQSSTVNRVAALGRHSRSCVLRTALAVCLGARTRGFSRLVSSVGYLAGPAVVGEGLADPPSNPYVRVVVAGFQCLDHSRDAGRGRAVGDGVDHVAADQRIGIPDQLKQPRPHPLVVSPDMAGAEVPARELASPAVLAAGQLQQSVNSILRYPPLAGRQADPYLLSDLAPPSHRPDDSAGRVPGPRIIPLAVVALGP